MSGFLSSSLDKLPLKIQDIRRRLNFIQQGFEPPLNRRTFCIHPLTLKVEDKCRMKLKYNIRPQWIQLLQRLLGIIDKYYPNTFNRIQEKQIQRQETNQPRLRLLLNENQSLAIRIHS